MEIRYVSIDLLGDCEIYILHLSIFVNVYNELILIGCFLINIFPFKGF